MFRLIVLYFFILCFCSSSCKSQTDITKTSLPNQIKIKNQLTNINPIPEQVGEYICDIFEDSKGNIWFATLQYGVAKYDGESLIYFTEDNGLTSNSVVSIVEDDQGIIWFGTQSGLSKYDGMKFVNYTIEDDLIHHSMSNLLIDQEGILWVGTWGGISLFDGKSFRSLDLPNSDVKFEKYQSTMHWITELMQDSKGNIWIGRDGYGATKFDGKNFKHFTTENGLESNNIQSILEDKDGKIWFGSRIKERDHPDVEVREKGGNAGLNMYDGMNMIDFQENDAFHKKDVYCIYEDNDGVLWSSSPGNGLHKIIDGTFHKINKSDRPDITDNGAVQGILQDSKGNFWIGFNNGLFQLKEGRLHNITPEMLGY